MKTTYQIQVQKVENGFVIQAHTDDPSVKRLVARTEDEVKENLRDLVEHMFDPTKVEEDKNGKTD